MTDLFYKFYKITYIDLEDVVHTIDTKCESLTEVYEVCLKLKGIVDSIELINPWDLVVQTIADEIDNDIFNTLLSIPERVPTYETIQKTAFKTLKKRTETQPYNYTTAVHYSVRNDQWIISNGFS